MRNPDVNGNAAASSPEGAEQFRRPYNIQAEQALLGSLMIDSRGFDRVSDVINGDHFYSTVHGRIFIAIEDVIAKGKNPTALALMEYFDTSEKATENLTVRQYLGTLAANATTTLYVRQYAETVVELAQRRALMDIGYQLFEQARDATAENSSKELIEETETKLFELLDPGSAGAMVTFKEAVKAAMDRAYEAHEHKGLGISTGIIDLDAKLGGLRDTDLIVLAGRPGMGKTALATNIAFNVARRFIEKQSEATGELKKKHISPAGFFSLEMSYEQLGLRILTGESGVRQFKVMRGLATEEDLRALETKKGEIDSIPLFIDDRGGIKIAQLITRARRMHRKYGIKLLIVDYLQLLAAEKSGGRDVNRVQELTMITTGLKSLAKELRIPIIALSQLSRGVESRDNKRPQLSDLRESGSIEQDADVVMFVYREEYYVEKAMPDPSDQDAYIEAQAKLREVKGKAEIIIGKSRHGPTGVVHVQFDGEKTKFSDLARSEAAIMASGAR